MEAYIYRSRFNSEKGVKVLHQETFYKDSEYATKQLSA